MTNELGGPCPVASTSSRFRPESMGHFKQVAKNISWLLNRPLQKCQEDLALIYGYSGLHEVQQTLKRQGSPGPYEPRYNLLCSDDAGIVEDHDRRIFTTLFGEHTGRWRDVPFAADRCFLVFEIGLFQEAAAHRVYFEKVRSLLEYETDFKRWPLINGWPLGLRSWLAKDYTETLHLAPGWMTRLPVPRYSDQTRANIFWQRRTAGVGRLEHMFKLLAPRVRSRKPAGLGRVDFNEFDYDGTGLVDGDIEQHLFLDWLNSRSKSATHAIFRDHDTNAAAAFAERPSAATVAASTLVKTFPDPYSLRDRWAFECYKAATRYSDNPNRTIFSSTVEQNWIVSQLLVSDSESSGIGEEYHCGLWEFHATCTELMPPIAPNEKTLGQPVIHATGAFIVPYDKNLTCISADGWFFAHDDCEYTSEQIAHDFKRLYLKAIGRSRIDFRAASLRSIVEITDIVASDSVGTTEIRTFFLALLNQFEESKHIDSHGYWEEGLALIYEDIEVNHKRREKAKNNSDVVPVPGVFMIPLEGCGFKSVVGRHKNGKRIFLRKDFPGHCLDPKLGHLAEAIVEATREMDVDVVVYDPYLLEA